MTGMDANQVERSAQRPMVLLRTSMGCAEAVGTETGAAAVDAETGAAAVDVEMNAAARADGMLLQLECDDAHGVFARLGEAARQRRPMLPARWVATRPRARGGADAPVRMLWVARSDAALAALLADKVLGFDDRPGRHDEPCVLLGAAGDPVAGADGDPRELVRARAEEWIQRLGVDRVALVVPLGTPTSDPVHQLARSRRIPLLSLAGPTELSAHPRAGAAAVSPWLSTDFQLDREHRLPDDAYIPGLRDLLHRGSLLRERSLFDRLPEPWRVAVDTELRALYAWHVSPLLRRAVTLLQTFAPLPGTRVQVPLPQLQGVCAWLLGLSDQRPTEAPAAAGAEAAARSLAAGLQSWDRRLVVQVEAAVWPRVAARLMPWIDAGMLAACPEAPAQPGRKFCFSGEPLWTRAPLRRDRDGVPAVAVDEADRRALGWFELELHAREVLLLPVAPVAGARSVAEVGRCEEQLDLGLEGWGT